MIINFTVQNYKSIKDYMLLNLTAAKRLKLDDTIPVEKYGMNVLPVTGIYGANGSGKSNLAKAISFMKERVLGNMLVPVPFLYESEANEKEPSEFSMLFTDDSGLMYHYGFSILGVEIIEEWLSVYYTKRESVLFTRARIEGSNEFEFYYGAKFVEATEGGKNYLEFVRKSLSSQNLFLSELAEKSLNTICTNIRLWFSNRLMIIDPLTISLNTAAQIMTNPEFKKCVTDIMKRMDFDFDEFEVFSRNIDIDTFLKAQASSNEELSYYRQQVETVEEGMWVSNYQRHVVYEKTKDGQLRELRLFIKHKRADGTFADLPINETSSGFKRLLDFASLLINRPFLNNITVVIDEIEQSLHTLISQNFIKTFKHNSLDGLCSQLVFITHDTNLLDLNNLRRDEIQFMEKDRNNGSSYITNYAEFKVVPGVNLEKGYLEGRYGAIPIMHHNLNEDCNG